MYFWRVFWAFFYPTNRIHHIPVDTIIASIKTNTIPIITIKSLHFILCFVQGSIVVVFLSKVLFVIIFRSLVLNYAYIHNVFVFNSLSFVINYIWFINFILKTMHFFHR